MFVDIEGIDGAGKTTVIKGLVEKLRSNNINFITLSEPTDSEIGKFIRSFLSDKERKIDPLTLQLLFIADRSYDVENNIKPSLNENKVVIIDRYSPSTIAYGSASGISMDLLINLNSIFPLPDKIIYLDIDPKKAMERIDNSERFHNLELLEKVRESYKELFKRPPFFKITNIINVNDKSRDEVNRMVSEVINNVLAQEKMGFKADN